MMKSNQFYDRKIEPTKRSLKKLKILFSHFGRVDKDGFNRSFMLARYLAKNGNSVTFLTSQESEFLFPFKKEIRNGVELITFPDVLPNRARKGGFGILNIILKSLYAVFNEFDIVQSDSGHRPSAGIPCYVNRFFKKSIYISEWWDYFSLGGLYDKRPKWYQNTIGLFDNIFEERNKKSADGVIALSRFTKKRAIKCGINKDKIEIIHGGADVDSIDFFSDTHQRSFFNLPEDCIVLGFLGIDDSEIDDISPFLEAVNELKKEEKVVWFSTGGKISTAVKEKWNIGNEYYEFGWIPYGKYSNLLSCADAFVLLLKDNLQSKARWPNKAGDYLAAGRPIITNNVGEIARVSSEYPIAFRIVKWEKLSIKSSIQNLNREADKKLWSEIRKIAIDHLSWESKANVLNQFYKNRIQLMKQNT